MSGMETNKYWILGNIGSAKDIYDLYMFRMKTCIDNVTVMSDLIPGKILFCLMVWRWIKVS